MAIALIHKNVALQPHVFELVLTSGIRTFRLLFITNNAIILYVLGIQAIAEE